VRRRWAVILWALFLAAECGPHAARSGFAAELFDAETRQFASKVDLGDLARIGVQHHGRIAILDTVARDHLSQACGRERVDGTAPTFAFLELYFNAGKYLDRPVIYVREKNMRRLLAEHLTGRAKEMFLRTYRLPPTALVDEEALRALTWTGRATPDDLRRSGRIASLLDVLSVLAMRGEYRVPIDRLSMRFSSFMAVGALRVFPTTAQEWSYLEELCDSPQDANASVAKLPLRLDGRFKELRDSWRARDAEGVERIAEEFRLQQREMDVIGRLPHPAMQHLERIYNRTYRFTIAWVGFAVSLVLMIVAAAAGDRARWPRRAGLAVLGLSTLVLLVGFAIRWLLSGRAWYLPPIMNQFEAVVGSCLLAGAAAIVLERIRNRNYFALSAAFYATVGLLSCFFLPGRMGAGIAAPHGILSSPVMAAHVAVIIVGHAFAGMTLPISVLYLCVVAFGGRRTRRAALSSAADLSAPAPPGAPAAIDRCNLIAAQLACWTVIVGTILGAYWADFAWGRWWGWDRKETWALLTALIYLAVLHVRFVTPRPYRGVVTAVGCLLGAAAMLFNWIAVNYLLPGLHSYA